VEGGEAILAALDAATREATLFAALCVLAGGLDDLLMDLIHIVRTTGAFLRGWWRPRAEWTPLDTAVPPGRIAVFVAAWDEAAVVGDMLRAALRRFDHPDYAIYVGAYPNDPATIRAVAAVAESDPRIRMVIGDSIGPTTKADGLNAVWRALRRDEAADGREVLAVVLHDAEDIVHPLELRIFAHFLPDYATVQLPVMPLVFPGSPLVSGHYADEFAEAHLKSMPVRQSLGAALPLAGVGCAIRRDVLERIAETRGGAPFDAGSLTEDYELGMTVRALGGAALFARVPEWPGGRVVAVRAYFPANLGAAIRQKARWMAGIALAGWDRTGWGRAGDVADHWMRVRDRRATLAMPVLAITYCTLAMWGAAVAGHAIAALPPPALPDFVASLLWLNIAMLLWRFLVRTAIVARVYGWREARWVIPRMFVGNFIALIAARRAVTLYLAMLAGSKPRWDKTEHRFPDDVEQAAA
jgi:adsorption protein B